MQLGDGGILMCAFLCVKDCKWCTVALLGSALLGSTPKVHEITSEDGTQAFEMPFNKHSLSIHT